MLYYKMNNRSSDHPERKNWAEFLRGHYAVQRVRNGRKNEKGSFFPLKKVENGSEPRNEFPNKIRIWFKKQERDRRRTESLTLRST